MVTLPGSWFLFRHEDNSNMLVDAPLFASDPATVGMEAHVPAAFQPIKPIHQRWLGGSTRGPQAAAADQAKAFTPRRIAELRPRVERITATLMEKALRRGDGRVDVIRDISFPLPMQVIGDALGVREADWVTFQGWARDIAEAVDRAGDAEAGARGAAAIQGMFDYFGELVAERRRKPVADLLGAMVAAADDDGQPMSEFDAIAISTELGVAGHETTSNTLGRSLIGLMAQRDRWAAVASR
jgi:cytochrome P450